VLGIFQAVGVGIGRRPTAQHGGTWPAWWKQVEVPSKTPEVRGLRVEYMSMVKD